jgi:EAL domain-containing protein (putative c-di-GMP-specific phosphodiesterase class I)
MIDDTERAIHIINDLKEMGIKISLDDFGTGYSSLVHLKLFHINTLKIDQLFIRKADLHGRDGAIISAIIELCHELNIQVVAEGVETNESLDFLKKRNCNYVQGFLFNPPLTVENFENLLESNKNFSH